MAAKSIQPKRFQYYTELRAEHRTITNSEVGVWLLGWTSWSEPLPPLPAALSAQSIGLALALCLIVWRLRDPLALIALALGTLYLCYRYAGAWLPTSELSWGILLLVCGFIALGAGIAINWRFRGSAAPEPPSSMPDLADDPAKAK